MIQHRLFRLFRIGKRDLPQSDLVGNRLPGLCFTHRQVGEVHRQVENAEIILRQHHALGKLVQDAVQLPQRPGELGKTEIGCEHGAH